MPPTVRCWSSHQPDATPAGGEESGAGALGGGDQGRSGMTDLHPRLDARRRRDQEVRESALEVGAAALDDIVGTKPENGDLGLREHRDDAEQGERWAARTARARRPRSPPVTSAARSASTSPPASARKCAARSSENA